MNGQENELNRLRAAIDSIDDQLLEMIIERAKLAAKVGETKETHGQGPFYVPSREALIIRRLLQQSDDTLPEAAIHGIFREIIGACLALEEPLSIAFLGPEGTFTHTAAMRQFGATAQFSACSSIENLFKEVESGRVRYGVVPVENVFEGAVTHALDMFAETNLSVCAEILLNIHHYLLTEANTLDEIELLLSHPQPLGQCREWIHQHLPHADLIEVASTAHAAALVKEGVWGEKKRTMAAIAPLTVAERLGLPVLRKKIEDHTGNMTRFLVIGAHDSPPSGEDKTALVISMKNKSGALHAILHPFATRQIGLSRIESRPSRQLLWEYRFFIDLEGHHQDKMVAEALLEIQAMEGTHLKVLGSYPVSRCL
ncbi:MAG: prephenate dehydratase [Mariprofundaceae bacterium]